MLSQNLEQSLHRALSLANERHHEYATLEHLLLSLTEDQDAVAVLRACGVDIDHLRRDLSQYIDEELSSLITSRTEESKPTAGFQRVLQRAAIHVQSSGREEVTGANVLVAIFSERESHAVYFLQQQEMTRLDAVNYISHGIAKVPGQEDNRAVRGADEEELDGEASIKKGQDKHQSNHQNAKESAKSPKGRWDTLQAEQRELERVEREARETEIRLKRLRLQKKMAEMQKEIQSLEKELAGNF